MMAQLMMHINALFHSRKIGFCTNCKRIDKVISIQFQYDFNSLQKIGHAIANRRYMTYTN